MIYFLSVVQDNQIAIRCDRTLVDNKGGVMISLSQDMQPTNTQICIQWH